MPLVLYGWVIIGPLIFYAFSTYLNHAFVAILYDRVITIFILGNFFTSIISGASLTGLLMQV